MTNCLHGSRYDLGCRCDVCVDLHSRYNRGSYFRHFQRKWGNEFPTDRVDPDYTRKIIWDAHAVRGLAFNHIARITGLDKKTVRRIYLGQQKYVYRYVEDIVREKLDTDHIQLNHEPHQLVDREPYYHIIRRLMAQGWTTTSMIQLVTDHTDYPTGWLYNINRTGGRYQQIEWQNAQAVMWLSEFIGDKRGPSTRNAIRMQNRGIFPQIHYTEDGQLIVNSLLPEQRAILKRLRSEHGSSASGGRGPRAHP